MTKDTMKAIVFDAPGKPGEVLRVVDMEIPRPAENEALIHVSARPIQPSDLMFVEGRYRIKPTLPQVAGLEGSGIVAAAGSRVALKAGTHVAFRYPGSWAEFVSVPQSHLYIVPVGACDDDAAQFALNPVTAWGLLDEARVGRGDWIAINAATSSVAKLVIGLARQRGVNCVGIVRASSTDASSVPTLAIEPENLSERILAVTGGEPVAALLDSVGGTAITRVLAAIKPGGTIVSYGMLEAQAAQMSNADMIYRNLCWKGFGIARWLEHAGERRGQMVDELWNAIVTRAVSLPVKARYSLDRVVAAIEFLESNRNDGKVLLYT